MFHFASVIMATIFQIIYVSKIVILNIENSLEDEAQVPDIWIPNNLYFLTTKH